MRTARARDPAGRVRRGELTDEGLVCGGRTYPRAELDIVPPVEPSKIVAVGPNYESILDPEGLEYPETPGDLAKYIETPNALVGDGDTVTLPAKGHFIHELELAVVIGEECRDIQRADAPAVVAGYTCFNDISNRTPENLVETKTFDDSAPIGPVVATPEEVPPDAAMELRVNGETRQEVSRTDLIHDEYALIADISDYLTLVPGDVIATGTPIGYDRLRDGDAVEVTIEGIGTLEHDVRVR